jgi:hypothetical protein
MTYLLIAAVSLVILYAATAVCLWHGFTRKFSL